jgi:putative inorganic carbon (HCO3(-)) transporter
MSLTLLAWLATFAVLAGLSMRRPAYGVSLYLFTYFINPTFWWWGDPIAAFRWNLFAGVILLTALILQRNRSPEFAGRDSDQLGLIAVLMAVNALGVHLILAPAPDLSARLLILLFKFVLLYFLMIASVRTRADLRLVLWSMITYASYIGYEVLVNDRGRSIAGRLEGIGAAGVQSSNELASLLLSIMPFGGYLFLTGTRREKVVAAVTTSLSLNVLLLCNSRGAFLGLAAAAGTILVMAPKGVRRQIVTGVALGGVVLVLLLGDPQILERFMTVFVSTEERDASADTRTIIWSAALHQIRDHPFGAGGESFSTVYGRYYLPGVGYDARGRSVHNGYLNEVTNWGFQGLLLRLAFFYGAFRMARRMGQHCARAGDRDGTLLAACLVSAMAGTLMTAIFGDYLDDEQLIWLAALMVIASRIYAKNPAVVSLQQDAPAVTAAAGATAANFAASNGRKQRRTWRALHDRDATT